MIVLADTHEKQPLEWTSYENIVVEQKHLKYGDYTLRGFEESETPGSIIIERKKNALELVGNLGKKWAQFEVEMERMAPYHTKLIIVGSPCNFEWLHEAGYIKAHPNFLFSRLAHIQIEYGISTLFMANREQVEHYMYRLFKRTIDNFGDPNG